MQIEPTDDYRRLVIIENTIFMYAAIGDQEIWAYDPEHGSTVERVGITDSDFIAAMNMLEEQQVPEINIRINSAGGSTKHGAAIMARMRNCAVPVHTFNDGTAASMAFAIWACGHKRHMATNAIAMIHHPWEYCGGNAQDMRDCAEILDKISESMQLGLAEAMGKTPDEVKSLFFSKYKDKYMSYTDIAALNLIDEDTYTSGITPDETAVAAAIRDPFAEYRKPKAPTAAAAEPTGQPVPMWEPVKQFLASIMKQGAKTPAPAAITTPPSPSLSDMNKEELKTALASGQLTTEDVQAILDEQKSADPQAALAERVRQLEANLNSQAVALIEAQAALKQIGGEPGASRSTPAQPDGDPTDPNSPQAKLDALNAQMAQVVDSGTQVVFQ